MRTLRNRVVAVGLSAAVIATAGCGAQKVSDDRRSVVFSETFGTFTVYVDADNRATGMAIDTKGGNDDLDLRASIVKAGQLFQPEGTGATEFKKDFSCSADHSPCDFDIPQTWASLAVDYGVKLRLYPSPYRDTFTRGLQCGRGGCNTLVQRESFVAKLFLNDKGKLVSLRLLETSKNFHLNIRLNDGREVDCIDPECRIWLKDGTDRTVIAKEDAAGSQMGFQFKEPLDWNSMRASSEGGLDAEGVSRSALVNNSSGVMVLPTPKG